MDCYLDAGACGFFDTALACETMAGPNPPPPPPPPRPTPNPPPIQGDGAPVAADDDASLLARIAGGDSDAFWVVWHRYHKDLFWTYHRLHHGNRQDIHDSLGSLCLRLLDDLPAHAHAIANCRTWLRRVAVNHFIDTHRTRRRHATPVGSLIEIASLTDHHACSTSDPEQASADRLLLHKVLGVMDRITDPRIRLAARQRLIEERPYRDIAAGLGVSEELVRKWIQQARDHLRRMLPDPAMTGAVRPDGRRKRCLGKPAAKAR